MSCWSKQGTGEETWESSYTNYISGSRCLFLSLHSTWVPWGREGVFHKILSTMMSSDGCGISRSEAAYETSCWCIRHIYKADSSLKRWWSVLVHRMFPIVTSLLLFTLKNPQSMHLLLLCREYHQPSSWKTRRDEVPLASTKTFLFALIDGLLSKSIWRVYLTPMWTSLSCTEVTIVCCIYTLKQAWIL